MSRLIEPVADVLPDVAVMDKAYDLQLVNLFNVLFENYIDADPVMRRGASSYEEASDRGVDARKKFQRGLAVLRQVHADAIAIINPPGSGDKQ